MKSAFVRLTTAGAAVIALNGAITSPSAADPATAMLVLSLAKGVLSLGAKKVDLSYEAIKEQSVAIHAIHERLDDVEASLATLLAQVNRLPKVVQDALDKDKDVNRKETLDGWVSLIQGISDDLTNAVARRDNAQIDGLRQRLRQRVDDLVATRSALFQRSDFILPALIVALDTELNALKMLPEVGTERARALKAYDERLAKMLDAQRPMSIVAMREALERDQVQAELALARALTGTERRLSTEALPWFSHTLQKDRTVTKHVRRRAPGPPGRGDLSEEYWDDIATTVTDDVHSRSWTLKIDKKPLQDAAGSGLFTLDVTRIGPVQVDGSIAGATKHHESDEAYEASFFKAHDATAAIDAFNQRARAVASLRDMEQMATAGRNLILHWSGNEAHRLASLAKRPSGDDASTLIDRLKQAGRDAEVRQAIEGMAAGRAKAMLEMDEAHRAFLAAVDKVKQDKWRADLLMGLELVKLSIQAEQIGERIGLIGGAKPVLPPSAAKPAVAAKDQPAPKKTSASGKPSPAPAPFVLAGITGQQSAETIQRLIQEIAKHPASDWAVLPPGVTAEETKLTLAFSLLNAMADTLSDKEVAAYNKAVSDAFSGSETAIVKALLLPKPTGGGSMIDAPARAEMRRQLNDLAAPFATRRIEALLKE